MCPWLFESCLRMANTAPVWCAFLISYECWSLFTFFVLQYAHSSIDNLLSETTLYLGLFSKRFKKKVGVGKLLLFTQSDNHGTWQEITRIAYIIIIIIIISNQIAAHLWFLYKYRTLTDCATGAPHLWFLVESEIEPGTSGGAQAWKSLVILLCYFPAWCFFFIVLFHFPAVYKYLVPQIRIWISPPHSKMCGHSWYS